MACNCSMLQAPENWKLRGGYGGVFLATNIVQKSLNYGSWPKITRNWRAGYGAFFVAKYSSNLFELCFMAKNSNQGAGEYGTFFCRQIYFKFI